MLVTFVLVAFSLTCAILSTIILAIVIKLLFYPSASKELGVSKRLAILITGCDSGIGLELAKYFLRTTDFTVICGFLNDVSSPGFQELSEIRTKAEPHRVLTWLLDVTSDSDIKDAVENLRNLIEQKQLDGLHALINNAGLMAYGEFDWLTTDQIMCQINVNLIGTIQLTRAMLPFIIQSCGRIVNVSSVNDCTVFPGLSVYSATKSAISTLSRGLGYELRKFSAHVVTVRLGDFARLTNIMSKHSLVRDEMWNNMNEKKRALYGNYFEQFNKHLLENYGMTSPSSFQNSSLFEDFRRAVLAKNPPTTITCAPMLYKTFYFIIELLPVWVQYYLLDLLFQFGFRWRGNIDIQITHPPQQELQSHRRQVDST